MLIYVRLFIVFLIWFAVVLAPRCVLGGIARHLIRTRFYPEAKNILFYQSGRSALVAIFSKIRHMDQGQVVLVPDYVCNLVYKAVSKSNLKVKKYKTDERFRADVDDIRAMISEGDVAAVLLASIFGTQNGTEEIVDQIRNIDREVVLILDECQNLIRDNQVAFGPRTVVISSFNLKNINGAMGGVICCREDFMSLEAPRIGFMARLKQEFKMVKYCVGAVLPRRVMKNPYRATSHHPPRFKDIPFEYSYCRHFPYQLATHPIATISLVVAILDMASIDRLEMMRRHNFKHFHHWMTRENLGTLIETERCDTSCFLPFRPFDLERTVPLPIKGPYATEEDEGVSIRPDVYCIRNTGIGCFDSA